MFDSQMKHLEYLQQDLDKDENEEEKKSESDDSSYYGSEEEGGESDQEEVPKAKKDTFLPQMMPEELAETIHEAVGEGYLEELHSIMANVRKELHEEEETIQKKSEMEENDWRTIIISNSY